MSYYESANDQLSELTIWYDKKLGIDNHFHRCLEFIYLLSGKLKITSYEDVIILKPHHIFCADSFAPHSITDLDGNSAAIVVIIPSFLMDDFIDLFQKQFFDPTLKDAEYNKNVILPVLQLFLLNKDAENTEKITHPYKNKYTEKGITDIIIGQLLKYKLVPKKEHDKNIKALIAILKYINEHYKENITLDKIANKFNYNKYYISKLFNKNIGQNLRTYINALRFQTLQTEIKTVQESPLLENIMADCGFASSSTYYRTQKKYKITKKTQERENQ